MRAFAIAVLYRQRIPLILYSAGSSVFPLVTLMLEEAFEPIVSTFSKTGRGPIVEVGRKFSSCADSMPVFGPVFFAKGFRIGIFKDSPQMSKCDKVWGCLPFISSSNRSLFILVPSCDVLDRKRQTPSPVLPHLGVPGPTTARSASSDPTRQTSPSTYLTSP